MPVQPCCSMTLGSLCISIDGTNKKKSQRYLEQQYGDGYRARRPDGINTLQEMYDITTTPAPVSVVTALENEIIALGAGSFDWQAPDDGASKKWMLDPYQWSWDYKTPSIASLKFTITRYYGS